jgi:hypothetical protein
MKRTAGTIVARIVPVFFRTKIQADFPEKVNRKQYSYEIYNNFLPHKILDVGQN